MFRVLIVEDDLLLLRQLANLFERTYQVVTAQTIAQADAALEKQKIDVVLLDRLVSDGDTIEMLPYIRDCSPSTRILMMSSRSAVEERISGLSEGADDYVPKPLEPQEVLLRVRRLLQLERAPVDDWLYAGILRFNRETGETYTGEHPIHLRPREAQILGCLLRFKNRVVTRDTIISHVWGAEELPTNTTLDVYLRRIRMILGEASKYIETVRGFGYLIRDPGATYK